MGKSNKALESKPQDDLEVIDMPADMKADETLVNDAELENDDAIFSQDDNRSVANHLNRGFSL